MLHIGSTVCQAHGPSNNCNPSLKIKEDRKTLIIQVIYIVKCHQKISDGVSKRHVPRILRQDEVIRTEEHSFESQQSVTFHIR